jgi:hypothetical protein
MQHPSIHSSSIITYQVRHLFNHLVNNGFPEFEHHLNPSANIVHSKDFESAIVAVLGGKNCDDNSLFVQFN